MGETWLEHLGTQLEVDVDYPETGWIEGMKPFQFTDMTSNQGFLHLMLQHESNAELLKSTCAELKDKGWLAIYNRMAILICKKNLPLIKGRVLLQTLPTWCFDYDKTLAHARQYAEEFEKAGVGRDRFCIKIPSTGPALNAAKVLQSEGIQTLGTALFGVPQAIAASQAGCLYISPYYNEVKAHELSSGLWPQSADPAVNHPMSARLVQILETYRRLYRETGKEQPRLKNASFISAEEAMAAAEMGCDSATISFQVLTELQSRTYDASKQPHGGKGERPKPKHPYADAPKLSDRLAPLLKVDPLAAKPDEFDGKLADEKTDWLANSGEKLKEAIESDPAAKQRFEDAMELFTTAQNQSQALIEETVASLG